MPVRKLGGRYLELHVRNKNGRVRVNSVGINAVEYPTRINNKFESISAISYQDCVYKSSLTGVKSKYKNISILRILNGLLNSRLFSY